MPLIGLRGCLYAGPTPSLPAPFRCTRWAAHSLSPPLYAGAASTNLPLVHTFRRIQHLPHHLPLWCGPRPNARHACRAPFSRRPLLWSLSHPRLRHRACQNTNAVKKKPSQTSPEATRDEQMRIYITKKQCRRQENHTRIKHRAKTKAIYDWPSLHPCPCSVCRLFAARFLDAWSQLRLASEAFWHTLYPACALRLPPCYSCGPPRPPPLSPYLPVPTPPTRIHDFSTLSSLATPQWCHRCMPSCRLPFSGLRGLLVVLWTDPVSVGSCPAFVPILLSSLFRAPGVPFLSFHTAPRSAT